MKALGLHIRFVVVASGLLLATTTSLFNSGVAQATPKVQVMVVGSAAQLAPATVLRPTKQRVKVGSRRCAIGSSTPLAALLKLDRKTKLGIKFHDYGHCNKRAGNSGSLFVSSIAGEVNIGQSGWVYKVGHRAGTTGSADTDGPFGDGKRLSDGDQVLWFWCDLEAATSCKPTLDLTVTEDQLQPGQSFQLTATGYDDYGNAVPAAGALINLGSQQVVTDSTGKVVVTAPTVAGRYQITATADGFVQSFPLLITVN